MNAQSNPIKLFGCNLHTKLIIEYKTFQALGDVNSIEASILLKNNNNNKKYMVGIR
jgi:hypothetical protein